MTLGLKRRCLACGTLSLGSYCPQHDRAVWHGRKYGAEHQRYASSGHQSSPLASCAAHGAGSRSSRRTPGISITTSDKRAAPESPAACNRAAGAGTNRDRISLGGTPRPQPVESMTADGPCRERRQAYARPIPTHVTATQTTQATDQQRTTTATPVLTLTRHPARPARPSAIESTRQEADEDPDQSPMSEDYAG